MEITEYNKKRIKSRLSSNKSADKKAGRVPDDGEEWITYDSFIRKVEEQDYKCYHCGGKFRLDKNEPKNCWKSLSCDRINDALPHTIDNCQAMHAGCNMHKKRNPDTFYHPHSCNKECESCYNERTDNIIKYTENNGIIMYPDRYIKHLNEIAGWKKGDKNNKHRRRWLWHLKAHWFHGDIKEWLSSDKSFWELGLSIKDIEEFFINLNEYTPHKMEFKIQQNIIFLWQEGGAQRITRTTFDGVPMAVEWISLNDMKKRFKNECNAQAICPGCGWQGKYEKIIEHRKVWNH